MELKHNYSVLAEDIEICFNRTSVELKQIYDLQSETKWACFNRTSVELKLYCSIVIIARDSGFNRTSVELKLPSSTRITCGSSCFNRTLVRSFLIFRSVALIEPVWNWNPQCWQYPCHTSAGFNRTSVELKLAKVISSLYCELCFNRTSVELKLCLIKFKMINVLRFNRTSVELKLRSSEWFHTPKPIALIEPVWNWNKNTTHWDMMNI